MSNQAIVTAEARLRNVIIENADRDCIVTGGDDPYEQVVDAVFERWAAEGLLWLPERGMGYYPVATGTEPYDAAYFDKYTAYRGTEAFRLLNEQRVGLVNRFVGPAALVCDIGIGDGAFIEARGFRYTLGFDVNPAGVDWLKRNGSWCDPYAAPVYAVTFWDCLEHIHDPAPLLSNVAGYVFVSIPIVPGDGPPRADWKHLRKDEHCWYFTRKGFIGWMREHGFECVEVNANETLAGREDIEGYVFRRVA